MNADCHACIGGTNVREDLHRLSTGVQIVVGTPGRVFDMINRKALSKSLDMPLLNIFYFASHRNACDEDTVTSGSRQTLDHGWGEMVIGPMMPQFLSAMSHSRTALSHSHHQLRCSSVVACEYRKSRYNSNDIP